MSCMPYISPSHPFFWLPHLSENKTFAPFPGFRCLLIWYGLSFPSSGRTLPQCCPRRFSPELRQRPNRARVFRGRRVCMRRPALPRLRPEWHTGQNGMPRFKPPKSERGRARWKRCHAGKRAKVGLARGADAKAAYKSVLQKAHSAFRNTLLSLCAYFVASYTAVTLALTDTLPERMPVPPASSALSVVASLLARYSTA